MVWSMAAHHTDRVQAVAGISTPYMRRAPMDPMEIFKQAPDGRCVVVCCSVPMCGCVWLAVAGCSWLSLCVCVCVCVADVGA